MDMRREYSKGGAFDSKAVCFPVLGTWGLAHAKLRILQRARSPPQQRDAEKRQGTLLVIAEAMFGFFLESR